MTKYITDDERQLFQDAMYSAQNPERQRAEEIVTIKIYRKTQSRAPSLPLANARGSELNINPLVSGADILSYSKPGLQHKKFSRLKQGKLPIEATLDLHEHTVDQAIVATELFLQRCKQRRFKNVCIIHGKGNYASSSNNKPILKNFINNYLRHHPLVIAFHSAKNYQGGTGAVIIIIKSAS
ncbi:MAG: hypothetical protein A3E82_02215 [Gammaproteobacteria bacterium RIFCSPHIGHO2_12_FULL_38_11]|nr:MAG: hypothetical protein A3E82_02215 [Gammaproteobacteria bacterium RIFCSPHIGHO2_12_FULL_38_11]